MLPSIAAMVFCIMMSAYFSATETAFSSLNKTRLKTMAEKGDKKAQKTLDLSERYDKLISTILIGNNVVNIAVSSIGTVFFIGLLKDGDLGATVSTIVITIVVLIFGEITPKSIAKDAPESCAMFSAPLLGFLMTVLTPINFLFSQWKRFVGKLLKVEDDDTMSQEELLMLIEEVEQDGSIDANEGDLLRNAIEFTDQEAAEILTHRVDLEGVPVGATKEEIAAKFTETHFSRLLVYNETIDDIVGIIHQKDFYVGTGVTEKSIEEITVPPVFVHKSEKIRELLERLQKEKSHMAIVIDEYGGTAGIVTMEDILEELVGEIWDEHDEVVEPFRQISTDTYIVDASISFDDFCEQFDIEDNEADSVSLGGWIMEQLDKIPDAGDKFEYENLSIMVKETDSHRVTFAEVVVSEKPIEEEE
ncbi:MAG: HlyC/CorC family transporter [Butyricicoccus sp.]|nr:HlyC/CorC family transporter [Butyricicoccus sp.]